MARRPYACEITKDYLKKLGIEYVSKDGTEVIRNGKQLKACVSDKAKKPYGKLSFHDPELYASVPKEDRTENSGQVSIDIHVLNYVWNIEDKPEGMVIDHIDNDPTNNDVSNLQCITQKENLAKEHPEWNTREIKCQLSKPRSFYEEKLEGYTLAYEQAKEAGDAGGAHLFRTNMAQTRARLRYYDTHIDEYKAKVEKAEANRQLVNDCHARAKKRNELQAEVDRSRLFYLQLVDAYGKDDPIVKEYYYEWKMAIAQLKIFKDECKKAKEA